MILESSIILAKYFPFSQLHVAEFQTLSFHIHEVSYTHIENYCYSTIDLSCIFFHEIYIFLYMKSLYLHNKCFVNVFDSFISVIMLSTLRFKSKRGTHP